MQVSIFKELTTDEQLNELKADSEKYTGLYVDMNEPEQRKYVKEKADHINQLLKKVDRKRIDVAKEFKQAVEKEAADIKERLEIANLPFTLLIDEHKAERKKILDAEKARKQAVLDAEQYELDHEMALLINKTFEFDREQERKAQQERDDEIRRQATIDAEARQVSINAAKERDRVNAENARIANKEHCSFINNEVLCSLAQECNLTDEQAKAVVIAIAKNKIPNTTINY